jgi:hypothetical protein
VCNGLFAARPANTVLISSDNGIKTIHNHLSNLM